MNYDAFERQISAGNLVAVYFFHGPQDYLVRRAVRMICHLVAERTGTAVQFERLDASEVALGEVLMHARSMSLFSSWRVIEVGRFDRCAGRAPGKGGPGKGEPSEASSAAGREGDYAAGEGTTAGTGPDKADLAVLEAYLEQPPEGTTLLLVAGYLRREELKRKLYKLLVPFTVECRVSAHNVAGWINRLARERGVNLDRDGVRLLREIVGDDLGLLEGELEKLALMAPAGGPIDGAMLKDALAETSRDDIYKLMRALGERRLTASLRGVGNLLATASEGTRIIAALYAHFNQLAMARELRESGLRKDAIAARVGVNPYFLEEYLAQASHFTRDELVDILEAVVEAEEVLKTSRLPVRTVLEGMVLKICGVDAARDGARS